MKRTFFHRLLIAISIVLFSIECYSADNLLHNKTLPDSIQTLLTKCNTDTCQFRILSKIFNTYVYTDFEQVRSVGEQAFEVIKNAPYINKRAEGYFIKGLIFREDRELDSAIVCFEQAVTLAQSKNHKYILARSYYNLASINVTLGEHTKVIAYSQKAIRIFEELKNQSPIYPFYSIIANAYKALNNFDSTLLYLNKSLDASRLRNDKVGETSTYLELAGLYKRQNNSQKEIEYLMLATKTADSLNDDDNTACLLYSIANYFSKSKTKSDLALQYYRIALEKSQKTNSKHREVNIYNDLGDFYLEQGNDSLALDYYNKCFAMAKEKNHRHYTANAYKGFGLIYNKQGNYKLALENYNKCFELGCKQCPEIAFHSAIIEAGDICLKLNNKKGVMDYYTKALALAEKYKAKSELAISNLKIANFYSQNNQPTLSETAYLLSLKNAKESESIELIKHVSDTLNSFYLQQNNFKEAHKYLSLAKLMTDSLNAMGNKTAINDFQTKLEFEKARKETEKRELASKQEIQQQRIYRNSLMIIVLLFAALGALIFVNYKRKKKDYMLLTAKNAEIEQISEQLHEADQAKLKFFANISHELRTPLTLIVSPLAKLLKENSNQNNQSLYSVMHRNSRKLQYMINQLLDISKIDKNELKLTPNNYNFNKQVSIIVAMFQSVAEEKNIEFLLTETDENLLFCFDAERMEQIVNNLLTNAFKFTPQNGKIELCISKEEENAILTIRDSGIGIPTESLERIFDRFYQTPLTKTKNVEGSGIGLALVKEFVSLHNGTISATSEVGKWTEFRVSIPMVLDQNEEIVEEYKSDNARVETYPVEASENKEIKKSKETILLVEDNNDLREYISGILLERYNVIKACNGSEGIELAKSKVPDIIISDVMMPETDGYQLTTLIRKNIETSHIPIILLTAKAGRESKIEGLERGADDYLNKPFDEEELLLKIKNILLNRQKMQEKYQKQISSNPSEINKLSVDEQFIAKIIAIIEKEMANIALDVDLLSSEMAMSRQQLYRKLKAITGLTPVEFIRSIRLKRAAQLLQQNAASVSEIAYMTGFDNLSYFTKRFKEEFGSLPSEYGNSVNLKWSNLTN